MTYETFLSIVEKTKRVKMKEAMQIVEELYRQADLAEDAIDEYCKIYDLFDLLLQQNAFIGDSDDYHNFAVVCARQDDYDYACRFLDVGLVEHPYAIDLLADYLNYGMRCNRKETCSEIYEKLMKRKDGWNWRAYRFSIDYLMNMSEIDGTNRNEEILVLIKEFQDNLPDNEDAYLIQAEFLNNNRNDEKDEEGQPLFVSTLQFATSDSSEIKRTPKCDLKLADYYYDNADIENALHLLERCKINSLEIQPSVNRSYVYLLSALCGMTQFYRNGQSYSPEEIESIAMKVYKDYHIAALNTTDVRVFNCKKLIESFVRETGIAYGYDDGINNDI